MGCGVRQNRFVADAFAAEVLTCVQAVDFANDMGFQYIEVEGDVKSIIVKL